MTAFRTWLLESATELAASDAHPSDPNMHLASAKSADRRVVEGHGGSTTSTSTTSTTSRNQPHGRHVALDYKTFFIEGHGGHNIARVVQFQFLLGNGA